MKPSEEIDLSELRSLAQELEDFASNIEDAANTMETAIQDGDEFENDAARCTLQDLEDIIPRLRGIPGELTELLGFDPPGTPE